ncbi:unnamed protein product [Heterosigma akashiwo]
MHESMDFDIKSFSEGVLMRFAECRKKRHGLNGCQPAALCAHFQRVHPQNPPSVGELRAVDAPARGAGGAGHPAVQAAVRAGVPGTAQPPRGPAGRHGGPSLRSHLRQLQGTRRHCWYNGAGLQKN